MSKKTLGRILNELLLNCKRSDRDIAKRAHVSQPTVTRTRHRLEESKTIKAYLAIPDYAKLGYKFGAVTLCALDPDKSPTDLSLDTLLISAPGITAGDNTVLLTLHRSMDDYRAFLKKVKAFAVALFATEGMDIKPVTAPRSYT